MSSQPRLLKRALSSPNLLRSFSARVRGKNRGRRSSVVVPDKCLPPKGRARRNVPATGSHLPEVIIFQILARLPQPDIASCATVSRIFASAARSALYTDIDTSPIPATKLESLIRILSSRSQLAELVSSFACPEWPPFFVSAGTEPTHSFSQRDTRLTAMFTLALERMYNLTSLTLPSFDAPFLAHYTSFGLRTITFLNSTISEAETKALFSWLDGQINISTLRFPNLFDVESSTGSAKTKSRKDSLPTTSENGYLSPSKYFPSTSPYPSPASSPTPSVLTQHMSLFTSLTLLPNLTTLHATPSLVMSLAHLENSRRPLRSVSLNINSTLYSGLRPASLMSAISGIAHLSLQFSPNVDRRSFEKLIGAAGAALGSSAEEDNGDPFVVIEKNGLQSSSKSGLRVMEISFQTPGVPGRDEVCLYRLIINLSLIFMTIFSFQVVYKSLQASLPRYGSLATLKLTVQNAANDDTGPRHTAEHDMIDSWVRACPTLTSITLFSGTTWTHGREYPTGQGIC
jgi:hypothetical protein